MINASNAILNDLAGAPISVGKFLAYSASNPDHGMSSAIFTPRLSDDNLPHEESSKSEGEGEQAQLFCTRAHWVMQRFCTILPVYLAHFSRSHDHITRPCNLSALIQQALDTYDSAFIKVNPLYLVILFNIMRTYASGPKTRFLRRASSEKSMIFRRSWVFLVLVLLIENSRSLNLFICRNWEPLRPTGTVLGILATCSR